MVEPSPFFLQGGPVGALLIHGFTGSPPEMRLIGNYLNQQGLTVSGPLLPGHGTTAEDLNRCHWPEWTEHASRALAELQEKCQTVFVGGLSMGSLLTLYLGAHNPDLAGLITYSPPFELADWRIRLVPVFKYLVRQAPQQEVDSVNAETESRLWYYDSYPIWAAHELMKLRRQVMRLTPQVTAPLLIIYSTGDSAIRPEGAHKLYEQVGSADKELVTLHDSGHVLTADGEWETVAQRTHAFIVDHVQEGVGA